MITRTDIAAHLERGARVGFTLGQRTFTPQRSAFVRELPSDGAFEIYADMAGAGWPKQNGGKLGTGGTDTRTKAQIVNQPTGGGAVTIQEGNERGLIVYNVDWQIGKSVEHNAINDDRAGDLESWARDAAMQFERHKDYLSFNALNAGAATTYGYGYDGVVFFSASHADPGAAYTTAQSNVNTLALSLDNYETVKVAASKFLDADGEPVGLSHSLLIVPPDLERIAFQIVNNREAYDTGNREANPYAGRSNALVAPGGWLDTTAWFVVDPGMPQKPINLQMRQDPMLSIFDDMKQGNGVRYYVWTARYTVFYGDWRLCVQGNS